MNPTSSGDCSGGRENVQRAPQAGPVGNSVRYERRRRLHPVRTGHSAAEQVADLLSGSVTAMVTATATGPSSPLGAAQPVARHLGDASDEANNELVSGDSVSCVDGELG